MSSAFIRPSLAALAALLLAAPSRADTLKVPSEFETIQAAVDAASTGDIVQVSKGTYAENVTIGTAGIELRGKSATIDGRYEGSCIVVTAADVVVTGFTLVNGGGQLVVKEGPGDGVPLGGLHVIGTNADISKMNAVACGAFGIRLEGTGIIEKCTADSCLGTGIFVDTDDVLGDTATEVSKNEVTRCIAGFDLRSGPFTIEKNTAEDNVEDGLEVNIPLLLADGTVLATTVSKNDCNRNGGIGMNLTNGSGPSFVIEKNKVEENGTGLRLNGVSFLATGNDIEDNSYGGANLFMTASEFSDNKVKGNGFYGILLVGQALVLDGGSVEGDNTLTDNLVQDNGGDGLRIQSDSNTIEGNSLKGNHGDGIQLIGGGVIDNHVADNNVQDNGHDGIDNSAANTMIHENVCKNNGGADLAGIGDGDGTVTKDSADNVTGDGTDLTSPAELEMDTID